MQSNADGKKRRFTKKEWSWIMYDWANSIYATNIMAAIFPTIFVAAIGSKGTFLNITKPGDWWWSIGTSIATFLVAILAPLLGAVADYKGMKKKLFTAFMLTGVVFTFLIALLMDSWQLMLVGYILSRIGFSGSCLFYDSFLTDVTTDERMDKVSSWGYAMGYIGGSTIPFVISIAVLLVLGYSNPFAQKFSILIVSLWWFVFSIPFLRNVKQEHYIEHTAENSVKNTFRNIGHTALDIFKRKGLFLFVLAYFFYIDGVGTIINISTAYGTVLGLGTVGMILALLVTQIVAMPCSIWFANIAQKVTARKALIGAIIIYTLICCMGFYMGFSLEPHQEAFENALKEDYYSALTLSAKDDFDLTGADEQALAAYEKLEKDSAEALRENDLAEFANKVESSDDYAALSKEARTDFAKKLKQYDSLLSDAVTAIKAGNLEEAAKTAQDATKADKDGKEGKYSLLSSGNIEDAFGPAMSFTEKHQEIVDKFNGAVSFSTILFWAMAFMVGTVQGGIQAVSRSYFGKLIPKKRSNEFYGFFDIFGKFASVMGPFLYATIRAWTGRSSYGVLALIALFLVGLIIMICGKKDLEALESGDDA